jgi:hypothetical protein
MGLRYTGGGYDGAREGFPARDLTADEVEALGGEKAVLETGLYEGAGRPASPKAKHKHEAEEVVELPAEKDGG